MAIATIRPINKIRPKVAIFFVSSFLAVFSSELLMELSKVHGRFESLILSALSCVLISSKRFIYASLLRI